MKYIKTYEASYIGPTKFDLSSEEVGELYTPLINWNLIEDAKDMALEYLDERMTLHLKVTDIFNIIYEVSFSHKKDQAQWYKTDDNDINSKLIGYSIYLTSDIGDRVKIDESKELIARLKMAYPKYMIH